jgi:hypothetical protein
VRAQERAGLAVIALPDKGFAEMERSLARIDRADYSRKIPQWPFSQLESDELTRPDIEVHLGGVAREFFYVILLRPAARQMEPQHQ